MKTAKEYLSQLYRLDNLISIKQLELESLKSISTSISVNSDSERVQTSTKQDKIGEIVAKILDLNNEINNDIDKLVDLKKEIMNLIDKVLCDDLRCILYLRYFQFKTWEKIAVEMNYSYQWIHKLHSKALNEVDRLLNS
jgi:DNA-directed RNA polymerase specialized sigma subunit